MSNKPFTDLKNLLTVKEMKEHVKTLDQHPSLAKRSGKFIQDYINENNIKYKTI